MLLTIHDANLKKVAYVDNRKQHTLNYFNDKWERDLETGSSTFEFTVYKKTIRSDTVRRKAYNLLNERAFVSFQYKGQSYLFSVMTVKETEETIECYCENLNLELINEYANAYKADKPMSFVDYCNLFGILEFAMLQVGINEIADQKRTLEWEGQDTKLARLLSLANKFDAEIDFAIKLNSDSSIKAFIMNIYHENDDTHQGVGRIREDVRLTYGRNLKGITRTIDKTELYTMVRPTGKGKTKDKDGNEVDTVVTIDSLPAWSERNERGVKEFYQQGESLYAPLSAQMYPSTFSSGTAEDQWIRKDLEVDSDNPETIRNAGIRDLKKNAYPKITYDIDGFIDVDIGDTVKMFDKGFTPTLLISARVSHQEISFTSPSNNKTTFSNFKTLKNELTTGIQNRIEELVENAKPYGISLVSDNGVSFKNKEGTSTVTAELYKGDKVQAPAWRWYVNKEVVSKTNEVTIRADSFEKTLVLTVIATIRGKEVARQELTFTNVFDGKAGASIKKMTPFYKTTTTEDTSKTGEWTKTAQTPSKATPYVVSYVQTELTDGTIIETEPAVTAVRDSEIDRLINEFEQTDIDNTAKISEILSNVGLAKSAAEEAKRIGREAQANNTDVYTELNTVRQNIMNAVNRAEASVKELKGSFSTVRNDLQSSLDEATSKTTQLQRELASQSKSLMEQAKAQASLIQRTSSLEQLADGTRQTISELSKTMSESDKAITSVSKRTKTVEDTLDGLRTSLDRTTATLTNTTREQAEYEQTVTRRLAELTKSQSDTENTLNQTVSKVEQIPNQITSSVTSLEKDLRGNLKNMQTVITQNEKGISQLSKSMTNTENTLNQTVSSLDVLNNKISQTVAKTDYDKLLNRMTHAETSIDTQAGEINKRLTSSQINVLIDGKGYATEKDVNTKLTNYVAISTYNNQVKETAKEYKRLITESESRVKDSVPTLNAFNEIRETVSSHTQTIGTVDGKVSRVIQTADLIQKEIEGKGGIKTQLSQLSDSWAVKTLTSAGNVVSQINANAGGVKIAGKLIQLDGQVVMDKAFIEKLNAIKIKASQIEGLVINAINNAMTIDLSNSKIAFNRDAKIEFNSSDNALVRKLGYQTAFVHFSDNERATSSLKRGLYASIGITSSGDGVNSSSSGRFAGARFFRNANGTEHAATIDQAEIYGDGVYLKDDFALSRGFVFKPSELGADELIDMNYLVNAVRALGRCFYHMKNGNWSLSPSNVQSAIMNEINNHIKNL